MVSDDDLRAYARGFQLRFRECAEPYARAHAEKLRQCGDHDGCAVWQRVADLIGSGEVHPQAA